MTIYNPNTPPPTGGYYIKGTEGNDTLYGSDYADEIQGLGGNDYMIGGFGNDRFFGDAGNDTASGGSGDDTFFGGAGDDLFFGGSGADSFLGGTGIDTASYVNAWGQGVTVDLTSGSRSGEAVGDTFSGVERFVGSNYGDIFNGDAYANIFHGGEGEDWLFGQGGNDSLTGGAADDQLTGGAGNDILFGGSGYDRLTGDGYNTPAGADHFQLAPIPRHLTHYDPDVITDFQPGLDRIDLLGFGATPFGENGWLEETYAEPGESLIGRGWFTSDYFSDDGSMLAYNVPTHTLYQIEAQGHYSYDDDDTFYEITSAVPLATFTNGVELHASDFLIM
jgi:Ca2+-binding RTX toxin-like protein